MEKQIFTKEELKEIDQLLFQIDPNKKVFLQSNNAVEESKILIAKSLGKDDKNELINTCDNKV